MYAKKPPVFALVLIFSLVSLSSVYAAEYASTPDSSDAIRADADIEKPLIQGTLASEQIRLKHTADPSIVIGTGLQLFTDDALIDDMSGAELLLHSPTPADIAIQFDAPWEGPQSTYVTVFRDSDRYRMYYRGADDKHVPVTCYAESQDGIHWVKPPLGLFQGSPGNNIVWAESDRTATTANFAPFKDTNPLAKRDELYKALAGAPPMALGSPDGIQWHLLNPDPVMKGEDYDSLNTVLWDSRIKRYVAYVRGNRFPGHAVRSIVRRTSKDFLHWGSGTLIDDGGAPTEQLYTNAIDPYFRAPNIFIGLPMRFAENRKVIAADQYTGISDAVFISSRDGIHFDRRFLDAFIRPGNDPENWTDRSVIPARGIVPTGSGEISIYYTEHYRGATNRLRRATLRTDGFVSLHSSYYGGEIITKPLIFSGSTLHINAATSAVGSVRVEILNKDGQTIPGFSLSSTLPFYGDEIDHQVSWKASQSSLNALRGRPVRLRFLLRDADLYSFHFGS